MSAEDLGKRLLGEVHEERLDELLASLRVLHDPTSSHHFGIHEIDNLLALFAGIHRPSIQPAERNRSFHISDDDDDGVEGERRRDTTSRKKDKAPPIIELTSPGSNDGKSQLLYYIIAISVLPIRISNIELGGREAAVVVLDTESRFSVPRLIQVMKHIISTRTRSNLKRNNPTATPLGTDGHVKITLAATRATQDGTIAEALKHVHIFLPQSLASLIATIQNLPTYLLTTPEHFSGSRFVANIVLDSASSFFWQDKAEAEKSCIPPDSNDVTAPTTSASRPSATATKTFPQTRYASLASAIKRASVTLDSPVVYTSWNLSSPRRRTDNNADDDNNDDDGTLSIRPHLPPPWQSLTALSLVVSRRPVRRFPEGMAGEEVASGEGRRREDVVEKGVFDIGVNMWGEEDWADRIREGVRREGGLEMRVTREGVRVGRGE